MHLHHFSSWLEWFETIIYGTEMVKDTVNISTSVPATSNLKIPLSTIKKTILQDTNVIIGWFCKAVRTFTVTKKTDIDCRSVTGHELRSPAWKLDQQHTHLSPQSPHTYFMSGYIKNTLLLAFALNNSPERKIVRHRIVNSEHNSWGQFNSTNR